jgi:uncharacterized protein YodC (DUF2158 family)
MSNQPSKFKVGDLVKLKSGSPVMTVTTVMDTISGTFIRCSWFGGKKLEHGQFPPDALEITTIKDIE